MKKYNTEHIEKYLLGYLTLAEKETFEADMQRDASLKEEVELQENINKRSRRAALALLVTDAHSRYANNSSNGLWKNGRNYLLGGLLLIGMISGIVYFNQQNSTEEKSTVIQQKSEQTVEAISIVDEKPPKQQKLLSIPFNEYTFLAEKGAVINDPTSGAKITIPKNALVTCDGQQVTGRVSLKYREFRNQADMAISHIPMTYQDQNFSSAGMFEIRAFQRNDTLCVASGKEVVIDFNMTKNDEGIGYYALNDSTQEWTFLEDIPYYESEPSDENDIVTQESEITELFPVAKTAEKISYTKDTASQPFELLNSNNVGDQFQRAMAALATESTEPEQEEIKYFDERFKSPFYAGVTPKESKRVGKGFKVASYENNAGKKIKATYEYGSSYKFPFKFERQKEKIILSENRREATSEEVKLGANVYDEMLLMEGMVFSLVKPELVSKDPTNSENLDDFKLQHKYRDVYLLTLKKPGFDDVFSTIQVRFDKDYLEKEFVKAKLGDLSRNVDLTLEQMVYQRYLDLRLQRERRINENINKEKAKVALADSIRSQVLQDSLFLYGQESIDNMAELIMSNAEYETKQGIGKDVVYSSDSFKKKVTAYLDTLKSLGDDADTYVQGLIAKAKERKIIREIPTNIASTTKEQKEILYNQWRKQQATQENIQSLNRKLMVSNFGIYNCDQTYRMGKVVTINATYQNQDGNPIDGLYSLSVINLDVNASFSYTPRQFRFNPDKRNFVVLFTSDGRVYTLNKQALDQQEINKTGNYTLTMNDVTAKVRSSKDLQQLLEAVPST